MAKRRGRAVASTYVSTGEGLTLSGDKELLRVLAQLPVAVGNKVLGPSLQAAGKPLAKAAKKYLQRGGGGWDTGEYRRSIGAKLMKKSKKGMRLMRVGARSEKLTEDKYPSNIDSLLEFGHGGPHAAEPVPHLRPAMDEKAAEAIEAFNRRAAAGIEKETARLARKAAAKAAAAAA